MAVSAAQWESIKADRIADVHGQLLELPPEYRAWVLAEGQRRGYPTLRRGASLGVAHVQTYDALIGRCQREIADRNTNPPAGDAA